MAGTIDDFNTWLFDRLKALNTDETVFGPYIKSIVDSEEDDNEKIEGLDGLLLELVAQDKVTKLRDEILHRWSACSSNCGVKQPDFQTDLRGHAVSNGISASFDFDVKDNLDDCSSIKPLSNGTKTSSADVTNQVEALLRLTELSDSPSETKDKSQIATSKSSRTGGVDLELREAILSHCNNDSDSEDDDTAGSVAAGKSALKRLDGLSKNDNAEKVLAEQREAKEKSRADHAKKKEKDKEDRAKQKKAAEDRKEKAKKKAQKTERKR